MQPNRAVIFVNGELRSPQALRAWLRPDDYLVAADAGYYHLRSFDLLPSLIIGDLDSLEAHDLAALQGAGVAVRRYPVDKDETDLELALGAVLQQGFRCIRIAAALGGRLDQTLGNISLLQRPDLADCDIRLDDGVEEVFLIRSQAVIAGRSGDRISLLPLNDAAYGVRTASLRYPLYGETLFAYQARGVSNMMLADSAQVSLDSGLLLCIHERLSDSGSYQPLTPDV